MKAIASILALFAFSSMVESTESTTDSSQEGETVLVFLRKQADLSQARDLPYGVRRTQTIYSLLTETARKEQVALVGWLKQNKLTYQRFHIANMILIEGVSPTQIAELASRKDVGRLRGNPSVLGIDPSLRGHTADPEEEPQDISANIENVKAHLAWERHGVTGNGVVIGGQDTGVEWDHPALKRNYRGFNGEDVNHDYSWHDAVHRNLGGRGRCGYNNKTPCDDYGHGTHTMGTAVGSDGSNYKIGVAPGARWIACKNMDNGYGSVATYLECFEWFLAPYPYGGDPMTDGSPEHAPDIINNSWHCPRKEGCYGDEMLEALQALNAAGILVVAAAGNAGDRCGSIDRTPSYHSQLTLAVGSHDHRNNRIAGVSSRGPSTYDGEIGPDVTAPGHRVLSAVPGRRYESRGWSGTSMAAPHVAGQAALLWEAAPSLKGDLHATIAAIQNSAVPTQVDQDCGGVSGDEIPNNTFGYGRIDVLKAVESVQP